MDALKNRNKKKLEINSNYYKIFRIWNYNWLLRFRELLTKSINRTTCTTKLFPLYWWKFFCLHMLHTVPITVTQIVFTNLTSTQEGAIINLTNNHKMFRIYKKGCYRVYELFKCNAMQCITFFAFEIFSRKKTRNLLFQLAWHDNFCHYDKNYLYLVCWIFII